MRSIHREKRDENVLTPAGSDRALDFLGMWTQSSGAQRVQIISLNDEALNQMVLRLPEGVHLGPQPEMVLYLFSLEDRPVTFTAPYIAGCFRNGFSYQRLIHPRMPQRNFAWLKLKLAQGNYELLDWRGVYPPAFIFWWTISTLLGARFPEWHFRLLERAYQQMAKRSNFTHLLTFYARRSMQV